MKPRTLRLDSIPRLTPASFAPDASIYGRGVGFFCWLDTSTGRWQVAGDWCLVGWMPADECSHTAARREGQIVLLGFHKEHGELWEHAPIFAEDRDSAVFCGKVLENAPA